MLKYPPWALTHVIGGLPKLRTDLPIVSSGRSFQIHVVCSAVSCALRFWFQLLKLLQHGYPRVVVEGVQNWAVWQPWVLVNEICTVLADSSLLFSCEIRSWKLYFRHFSVNTAWSNVFAQICVLNKWATFGAKNIHAFLRYSDLRVGIFYFASPCMCLYLCTCCYGCQVLKVDHNNLVEIPSLLGRLERLTSFSCASQRPRVRLLPGSVTRLRQLQVSSNAFFPARCYV